MAIGRNPGTTLGVCFRCHFKDNSYNFFFLDLGWVNQSRVSDHAVKKRIDDILASRFVQEDLQIEWLARSIQCIDLTTLAGNLQYLRIISEQVVSKKFRKNRGIASYSLQLILIFM